MSHGVKHLHSHGAGWAGQVCAAEGQTIYPHAHFCEHLNGAADVNGVVVEPVGFGYDQNNATLQLIHNFCKVAPLRNKDAAGNRLGDNPARFNLEGGGFDFLDLVLGGLTGRGSADIGEGAWNRSILSE